MGKRISQTKSFINYYIAKGYLGYPQKLNFQSDSNTGYSGKFKFVSVGRVLGYNIDEIRKAIIRTKQVYGKAFDKLAAED